MAQEKNPKESKGGVKINKLEGGGKVSGCALKKRFKTKQGRGRAKRTDDPGRSPSPQPHFGQNPSSP